MARYDKINPDLFIKNREKIKKEMLPNSLMIIHAADQFPRNGDQNHKFRQNSDLFYLTGLDQEKTVLLLYPDCVQAKYREVIFTLESSELITIWEGHKNTKEEVKEISGVANVHWLDQFETILHELMASVSNIYLNQNENPRYTTEVPYKDLRFARIMHEKYPNHAFHRAAPLITKHRLIKESEEIDILKKACEITGKAFTRVMKTTKPGKFEFELEADISHEFTMNRASGHGYEPIVASGANALCLHYNTNNEVCKDGDLVLFDFGAEYANYSADLSRTIPVNGKFTKRQKEVYNAVLRVFRKATQLLVPETTIDEINAKVGKMLEAEMIGLGLFTEEDVKNQNPDKPLYTKYFPHGNSHFLGLDVHDCGTKQTVLKAGMVLTCEPGLYISEENIGVRIENDILVTDNGPVDLMDFIPVEADEIEKIMSE